MQEVKDHFQDRNMLLSCGNVSERVAPRLVLPGVVVTWFVTGFPDPGQGFVKVGVTVRERLTGVSDSADRVPGPGCRRGGYFP